MVVLKQRLVNLWYNTYLGYNSPVNVGYINLSPVNLVHNNAQSYNIGYDITIYRPVIIGYIKSQYSISRV